MLRKINQNILTGLITLLPVILTLYLLYWFIVTTESFLGGLIAIVVSLIGAGIMLYDPAVNPLPMPQNASEWLAVSAGMGFSLTNVITRKSTLLSVRAKSFAVWFGVAMIAVVLILVLDLGFVMPQKIALYQWAILLMIALLLITATVFVQYGVTKITAVRASILFMFELVVAAIAAYYLAKESMSLNEWIGGALIVSAAIFSSWHHED